MPLLTDDEIAELTPILREQASWYGPIFPAYRMDSDDFVQQGFLGILAMAVHEAPSAEHLLCLRLLAAKNSMIDAMRTFSNPRSRIRPERRHEYPVPHFDRFAEHSLVTESAEDALDLKRFAAQLPPREQRVFWGRYQGYYHREIAEQLRRTESRACQIEKDIIAKLQEAA